MDWNRIQSSWQQIRGQVRDRWGKLTEDDLNAVAGRRDALMDRLQQRYGYTQAEAEQEIIEWSDTLAIRG